MKRVKEDKEKVTKCKRMIGRVSKIERKREREERVRERKKMSV